MKVKIIYCLLLLLIFISWVGGIRSSTKTKKNNVSVDSKASANTDLTISSNKMATQVEETMENNNSNENGKPKKDKKKEGKNYKKKDSSKKLKKGKRKIKNKGKIGKKNLYGKKDKKMQKMMKKQMKKEKKYYSNKSYQSSSSYNGYNTNNYQNQYNYKNDKYSQQSYNGRTNFNQIQFPNQMQSQAQAQICSQTNNQLSSIFSYANAVDTIEREGKTLINPKHINSFNQCVKTLREKEIQYKTPVIEFYKKFIRRSNITKKKISKLIKSVFDGIEETLSSILDTETVSCSKIEFELLEIPKKGGVSEPLFDKKQQPFMDSLYSVHRNLIGDQHFGMLNIH